MYRNPIIYADYPDPDVIRVGDTYYMVCTTMHLGRIPVIVPMHWDNDLPVLDKHAPALIDIPGTRPGYVYQSLIGDDDFHYQPDHNGRVRLQAYWQWNHTPDGQLWSVTERPGAYRIRSGKISPNLNYAVNTLTQRAMGPVCEAMVTLDGSQLKDGDYAGICFLISSYGFIALAREAGEYYFVMKARSTEDESIFGSLIDHEPGREVVRIPTVSKVTLKARGDFVMKKDECEFYYLSGEEWKQLGEPHHMVWKMDCFTGAHVGLFLYSTKQIGGVADFLEFKYGVKEA